MSTVQDFIDTGSLEGVDVEEVHKYLSFSVALGSHLLATLEEVELLNVDININNAIEVGRVGIGKIIERFGIEG